MAANDEVVITKSKLRKYVTGAILTIFLGAIGSGLWERFFSPVWDKITNLFLRSISFFFHGYVNILHYNIGKAQTDQFMILPYVVVVVTIIMFPWLALRMVFKLSSPKIETKDELDASNKERKTKRRIIILTIMAFITTLMYGSTLLEDSYTRKACIFVERSIEILAPHITQQKYYQLRASYRSIDSAEKFYTLEAELQTIAAGNKVVLPEFKVIR